MKTFAWALLAGLLVSSCVLAGPMETGKWRYKMTVVVETPEGLKSGSAVREVTWRQDSFRRNIFPTVQGEAVVVDLGARGKLFALMRSEIFGVDYRWNVLNLAFPRPPGANEIGYFSTLKGVKQLPPIFYPMIVHFKNMNDPLSVESLLDIGICAKFKDGKCVQPDSFVNLRTMNQNFYVKADRFEDVFGKGVKLKEIDIEMTDSAVTKGIESVLSWISSVKMAYLDGRHDSMHAPLGLIGNDFIAGQ